MTAPDRIAAYWTAADNDTMPSQMLTLTPKSPRFHDDMPKSQRIEYIRADLVDPTPLAEALAVPEVKALVEALRDIDALDPEVAHIGACSENAIRGLVLRMGERARAALRAIGEGKA